MANIDRIQAQLRSSAASVFEVESTPPFICYFNPDDPVPHSNYAMPDTNEFGDLTTALDQLIACFVRRGRRPRFEYLASYAPSLAEALERHGFDLEMRTALMVCTPESIREAPPVPGLEVTWLTKDAPIADVQDFVTVQKRAFGTEDDPAATAEEAQRFRERFGTGQIYLARLNGEPVGAGSLTQPDNGIAEVAGISTAAAYRRRGIAAALTAHIARTGFASGLDTLFPHRRRRAGRTHL